MNRTCYRPDEFEERHRVSKRTVYRMIASGKLKAIRIGSVYRIPGAEWCRHCNGTGTCKECERKV